MNLYFKFAYLIMKRLFFKKKLAFQDTCVSHFRVGLLDLDLNFHMNNGRFFSVMDLGRFDWLMRAGHFYKLLKAGYYPLVLSESMVFQKSLGYLQAYELHTQMEGWDKKFFYIKQNFVKNGKTLASASVRGCFKKRGVKGVVPTQEVFDFLEETAPHRPATSLMEKHQEMDQSLFPR